MQNNFKYLIVISLLLSSMFVHGQTSSSNSKKDTLFVFDTITVYDTVYVYDTIRATENLKINPIEPKSINLTMLQLDTTSNRAILLIISKNQTATIPINGIILKENIKKLKSMKKLSFFGVALFAFQSMVMAQTNLGISAGGGIWWAKCNEPIGNIEYSPTLKAGLFLEHSMSSHVFLKTELNYTFLMSNYSYKAVVDSVNWIVVGEGESATDYHQISIPLQIGYAFGKVKPYFGLEYSYRFSESWLNKHINSFGLSGGINYLISDKFSLSLNYYHGLTNDYEHNGTILNPVTTEKIGEYNDCWKSSRLGLTLYYTFKKKE